MSDQSATAETINAAIKDPVPHIAEPPNTAVRLLKGYNGNKDAVVREMTGADEEHLANIEARRNLSYPEYVSALLKRTVISVGSIEVQKDPEVVDQLIIGDRDILFLATVRATYGSRRTYTLSCPHCSQDVDLSINLDEDFSIQGTEEDAERDISVVFKNGMEYQFRLPNGEDSLAITKKSKNLAEQNTLMISRCVTTPVQNKEAWARNLNIGDRTKVVNAIFDVKIGPKAGEVNDPCPSCGKTINLPLDWVSLLFG